MPQIWLHFSWKKGILPGSCQSSDNASATRENILTALGGDWLPRNAGSNDIVFVYFASHVLLPSKMCRKSFLIAYDTDPVNAFATGIELQDLCRTVKRRIASNRIIIVLDACHAGAAEPGAKASSEGVVQFFRSRFRVAGRWLSLQQMKIRSRMTL